MPGAPPARLPARRHAIATSTRRSAGVALLDAAWPESCVVVMHDDTDPGRRALDPRRRRALDRPVDDLATAQLRATLEAAADGHGLIDVDVVRPVIDLYATLHAETRRRNRAVIESLAAAVEAKDTVTVAPPARGLAPGHPARPRRSTRRCATTTTSSSAACCTTSARSACPRRSS